MLKQRNSENVKASAEIDDSKRQNPKTKMLSNAESRSPKCCSTPNLQTQTANEKKLQSCLSCDAEIISNYQPNTISKRQHKTQGSCYLRTQRSMKLVIAFGDQTLHKT